jgi:hypothetical protein
MRLFSCQSCSQILFFENIRCERCRHALGFNPIDGQLSALEVAPDSTGDTWTALGTEDRTFRLCANAKHDVCNWLVDATSDETMCAACRHNRVIPELGNETNRRAWRKIEVAKHRLFYTLYRMRLAQTVDLFAAPEPLVFRFLADHPSIPSKKVMTGHEDGVITIALSEADDAERELRRTAMGEPYRTLLGHFRHEVGHYFWDRLVRDGGRLEECRAVFGNDEEDYEQALKRHYEHGAPIDWQEHYVSTYATAHPWEDFAETWAHYLHIVDTLEMARAYDLKLSPSVDKDGEFAVHYAIDPYDAPSIQSLIDVWLPVSTALNSLSHAMGKEDLYPFILSPGVVRKLGFMHELVGRIGLAPASPARLAS